MDLKCFVNGCKEEASGMWELNKQITYSCRYHKIEDQFSKVIFQEFDPIKVPKQSSSKNIIIILSLITAGLMIFSAASFITKQNQFLNKISKDINDLKSKSELNYKFYMEVLAVKDLLENSEIDIEQNKKKVAEIAKVNKIFNQRLFSQNLSKQDALKGLLSKDVSLERKLALMSKNLGILLFSQESEVLSIAQISEKNEFFFGLMEGSMVKLSLVTHAHEVHLTGKSRLYGITPTSDYSLTYLTGDTSINIYSQSSKKVIKSIPGHSHWILSATISDDQKYLATGSCDRMIKFWDQFKLTEAFTLSGHEKDVWSLSISRSNLYLVSGSEDKQVILWDLINKSPIHKIKGHTAPVYSVIITKDLNTIISGGGDGAIHIWDIESKSLIHTFNHTGLVRCLHLLDRDRVLLSISGKTLKVWDLYGRSLIRQLNHTDNLISLTTSKDLKFILIGDVTGRVWVWDLQLSQLLWVFAGNKASVKWLQVSNDLKYLAIGERGLVRVWNLDTQQQMQAIVNKDYVGQWKDEFDVGKFLEVLD